MATPQELEFFKRMLGSNLRAAQALWLENQLLRSLILDPGWMTEPDLEEALARGSANPENQEMLREHFAADEQRLAEIGLADTIWDLESLFPPE
jgi:hypothetical protein